LVRLRRALPLPPAEAAHPALALVHAHQEARTNQRDADRAGMKRYYTSVVVLVLLVLLLWRTNEMRIAQVLITAVVLVYWC
jgi:hypothetical protein